MFGPAHLVVSRFDLFVAGAPLGYCVFGRPAGLDRLVLIRFELFVSRSTSLGVVMFGHLGNTTTTVAVATLECGCVVFVLLSFSFDLFVSA